jgi:hypothetical protein
VRRAVRRRDGEQCSFVLLDGSRCPERRGLEFHHRHPYGRGGTHEPDNICLMCRQHNAYAAEVDYGKERIAKYRRRDRVCESAAVYVATFDNTRAFSAERTGFTTKNTAAVRS